LHERIDFSFYRVTGHLGGHQRSCESKRAHAGKSQQSLLGLNGDGFVSSTWVYDPKHAHVEIARLIAS
jgi:hypothetical protein